MEKLRKFKVTVSIPRDAMDEIDLEVKKGRFGDVSKELMHYYNKGKELESLEEISKDSEKIQEFETKIKEMFTTKKMEQHFETCNADQLKGIIGLARTIYDKKVQQMILDIKMKR